MKVISYSIFGDPASFEFPFYMRGLYFNARMNKLIYPEWRTAVAVEISVFEKYQSFFSALEQKFRALPFVMRPAPLCESMLWRMAPIFYYDTSHVICRDADAITTYKEAQAVQEWIDSGLGFHGITDNPAHTLPLMGGMCGFRVDHFKQTFPEYDTFEKLVAGSDLKNHGSDQNLLMKKIYPKAKGNLLVHSFSGYNRTDEVKLVRQSANGIVAGVSPKLWESNLTCRHIGSPGVVDFETLRFFKRFDKTDYSDFEKEFKDICYWQR